MKKKALNDCLRKVKYDTPEQAKWDIKRIRYQKGVNPPVELKVYKCPICGGYHITRK